MENSNIIKKAIDYIRDESSKCDITIDDVAANAGFSTNYFNSIFAAHTGFNVMEYVRFIRLKKAAILLRKTDRDLLDIALECGYEAHESFTRAFKKQYGMTPSEYRERNKDKELLYGEFNHETVGAQIIHEFPQFRIIDRDEVIDYILEYDSLRFGYRAACFLINGGVAICDGEDISKGFIWVSEWDNGFGCEIFSDDYDDIAKYLRIFKDERFIFGIFTMDDNETVERELSVRGVAKTVVRRIPNKVYIEEPFMLQAPKGIHIRELSITDMDEIEAICSRLKNPWANGIRRNLHMRDVLGNKDNPEFIFGIYLNENIIGLIRGSIERVREFAVNNCIVTVLLEDYRTDDIYRHAYKYVTNKALERGALPIDDIQYNGNNRLTGNFDSEELGYRTVTNFCVIK